METLGVNCIVASMDDVFALKFIFSGNFSISVGEDIMPNLVCHLRIVSVNCYFSVNVRVVLCGECHFGRDINNGGSICNGKYCKNQYSNYVGGIYNILMTFLRLILYVVLSIQIIPLNVICSSEKVLIKMLEIVDVFL